MQHPSHSSSTSSPSRSAGLVLRSSLDDLRESHPVPVWVSDNTRFSLLIEQMTKRSSTRAVLVPPHAGRGEVFAISRDALTRKLGEPFFSDVFGRCSVAEVVRAWPVQPLILPAAAPLTAAVDAIAARSGEWRYEPVVVRGDREEDDYFIVEVHDVLAAQCDLLERTQINFVEASRLAGRAEVACGILHDVGNVLNSVCVAAQVADEYAVRQRSVAADLARAAAMVRDATDAGTVAAFFAEGPGRHLVRFLDEAAERVREDNRGLSAELAEVRSGVSHITASVAAQQATAGSARLYATFAPADPRDIVQRAVMLEAGDGDGVQVLLDLPDDVPSVTTDAHRVTRVLTNFLANARWAVRDNATGEAAITAGVRHRNGPLGERLHFFVLDDGCGFDVAAGRRLFTPGYTGRQGGHGIGLHASAVAAEELGGSVRAHSDGPGRGALFELILPLGAMCRIDVGPASDDARAGGEEPETSTRVAA